MRRARLLGLLALAALLGACADDTGGSGTGQPDLVDAGSDADIGNPDLFDAPDSGDDAPTSDTAPDGPGTDAGGDSADDADASASDSGDLADGLHDAAPGSGLLGAPHRVALAYVSVGETVPPADLTLTERTGAGPTATLGVTVEGPFTVTGDLDPLPAGAQRALTVAYDGPTDAPAIALGAATVAAGGDSVRVELAAVVGPADLADADWSESAYATTTVVPLANAPFPHSSASYTDASVVVAVPPGLAEDPGLEAVVHFHGFNADVENTVAAQRLVEQLYYSGRDALFIAPQGPLLAADPNFGKLTEQGGLRRLVDEVLMVLYRDGFVTWPSVVGVVLTSHSGGYEAAATTSKLGEEPILGVHLYDSLYARETTFRAVVTAGGILRSNYTAGGGTLDNNQTLLGWLGDGGVTVDTTGADGALLALPVTIVASDGTHNDCMWHERTAARWLAASGLRRRPSVAPELLLAEASAGTAHVVWRGDRGAEGATVGVEGSTDGVTWERLAEVTGLEADVPARPWLRVVTLDGSGRASAPSDVYGATGGDWLVVDGFDRVFGGSYHGATHPFAAFVGTALARPFSTASNEAVAEGLVDLGDYAGVVWLLGDESVQDKTFDAAERAAVENYLDAGGDLLASGAEIGYATGGVWLSQTLHAAYVSDDAGTTEVEDFTFGAEYEEDYPDVLNGDTVLWHYATGGGAAVGWAHRVVVVGFGLENLAPGDRAAGVGELADWLEAD